jgi:hypothetical protein
MRCSSSMDNVHRFEKVVFHIHKPYRAEASDSDDAVVTAVMVVVTTLLAWTSACRNENNAGLVDDRHVTTCSIVGLQQVALIECLRVVACGARGGAFSPGAVVCDKVGRYLG